MIFISAHNNVNSAFAFDKHLSGNKQVSSVHGPIIKWTQHIGFLTLTGMTLVVERIMGTILKKSSKNSVFIEFGKI